MINLDNKLIIQFLESLSNVFPNHLSVSQVLPERKDRHEIDKYAVYCKGRGWVELKETMMTDGSIKFNFIRITSQGIDYLLEKSK